VDDKTGLLALFDLKTYKKGSVISTPTGGPLRLSIIISG
jgi:hypothetical protein